MSDPFVDGILWLIRLRVRRRLAAMRRRGYHETVRLLRAELASAEASLQAERDRCAQMAETFRVRTADMVMEALRGAGARSELDYLAKGGSCRVSSIASSEHFWRNHDGRLPSQLPWPT